MQALIIVNESGDGGGLRKHATSQAACIGRDAQRRAASQYLRSISFVKASTRQGQADGKGFLPLPQD
ncbi:hypothetical protein [Nitrosomonas halophila]|uniref:Uncharacterized protein n=1 Tax=Nitrosomonas halophila TaxID=44576 RepID=A0A1H3CNE2_9PROT|nr:hypothetical protein [Nitrosomonas halophila]SDX55673.1 hypothetical protein SAMN05421881_100370 [Nitrosomonas halophila]